MLAPRACHLHPSRGTGDASGPQAGRQHSGLKELSVLETISLILLLTKQARTQETIPSAAFLLPTGSKLERTL